MRGASGILRREELCRTSAGNVCEVLTITEESTSPAVLADRPGVVITARVHPGESDASWMMQVGDMVQGMGMG